VLKLAVSFKDRPKKSAKHYVLKDHKNEKNHKTKKVWVLKEKQVEEVKMLSEKFDEPLLDLDKYCLNELINIMQSFANDPSFSVHQNGFGSYIANHVIKENIQIYNNEAMIPAKLGMCGSQKYLLL
jgi:hypothetical protein